MVDRSVWRMHAWSGGATRLCFCSANFVSGQAERDGQSEAIATNLTVMAGLRVPIVCLIMGEGGSGGALGVGMGNRVGMLSRAYFGVVSVICGHIFGSRFLSVVFARVHETRDACLSFHLVSSLI